MQTTTKIGRNGSVKIDRAGLEALINASNAKFVVKIGILGSQASGEHARKKTAEKAKTGGHKKGTEDSPLTNAQIGFAHEKGIKSRNLPRRSWLVTPLEDHLGLYFRKIGAQAITDMLLSQPQKAYEELGAVCEQIIFKGFETGGYGKWKPLKASTIRAKGSSAILIDTAQLKNSVTAEVITK